MLLSIDPEYFDDGDEYLAMAEKIFEGNQIDWPSVFMPGGWNDAVRTFNASGYGNVVVDAEGIVRGIDLHGRELERLVEQLVESGSTNGSAE